MYFMKWMFPKFYFTFADGDEGGEPSGVEILEQAMRENAGEGIDMGDGDPDPGEGEVKPDQKPEADPKPDTDPTKEEIEAMLVDPEKYFSMKIGEEEVKIKGEDLIKGFMQEKDYTQKMQEFSQQREEIAPLLQFAEIASKNEKLGQAVLMLAENALDEKNNTVNEQFLDQFLGSLTGENKADPQINDQQMAELLSGLDPDSELGQVMKLQLSQISELKNELKQFKDSTVQQQQQKQTEEQQKQYAEQVKEFRATFDNTFNALTDKETGICKFNSPDLMNSFKDLVKAQIRGIDKQYQSKDDFVAHVKELAQNIYKQFHAYGESVLSQHVTGQKNVLPASGGNSAVNADDAPKSEYRKERGLEGNISSMLEALKDKT